jgi:DnaJ homolog subfamily C member 17
MDKDNEEKNAYEVVGVGSEATEADIKKAFRQRSLKTHPDRVRCALVVSWTFPYICYALRIPISKMQVISTSLNSRCHFETWPYSRITARLFHELTQAYELLLDPLRRMALDAKLRIQEARKQRYANFDKKRKAMLEELEEAEQADKKAKSAEAAKKQRYAHEADQIRDAGRRMVEERQAELRRQQEETEKSSQDELEEPPPLGASCPPSWTVFTGTRAEPKFSPSKYTPPPLPFCTGEYDTTVRLKYPLAKYPHLTTTDALHTFMTSTFGPVDKDTIVLSIKPPKKAASASAAVAQHKHRPPKHATAAVPFKTVADAHAAVCASGRADRGLEEFEIGWMAGCEPAVWSWSERMMLRSKEVEERPAPPVTVTPARGVGDRDGRTSDGQSSPGTGSQFSSFPSSFVRI